MRYSKINKIGIFLLTFAISLYHSLMKLSSIKEGECEMKRRIYLVFGIVICFLMMMTGCGRNISAGNETSSGKLTVVTTLFPQYDFARQIGGEYADVSLVLLPGGESYV